MSLSEAFQTLEKDLESQVIDQPQLVRSLIISLLADGHLLVEGAPGLAKTKAIKEMAARLHGHFNRIQFTPDLLPSDITGTEIYHQDSNQFVFQEGPVFANLILADEINRSPAKVQSALLEAMSERQVTVAGETRQLDDLFLVMATQNPLEQEGTYPLPEAQLDRFLMHVFLDYPNREAELKILRLVRGELKQPEPAALQITKQQTMAARQQILELFVSEAIEEYMVQLTLATRHPQTWGDDLASWLTAGVSPRATIALERCARAQAWLSGRDFVTPDDVQSVFPSVYRHRLYLSYEAMGQGISSETVVQTILQRVPIA
ncbi:AAA family ATPase [Gynuella sp.]|uniref:AAA family ATPase n=1 Tax=Gynuella sp. TaxID=2969146 RepID=UPI003D0B0820